MKYLYNKEVRYSLYFLFLILAIFSALTYQINQQCAILLLVNDLLLIIIFVIFTNQRYRKIQKMSSYLQTIYEGCEAFDIRDYEEGELSVLKSDLYKITQILRQQKDVVLKDRSFLADNLGNISHQLKTPLTSVLVMCDLLRDEDLPTDKRKQFLMQMHNQLERIEWLVTTLLKISKIDANAITFDRKQYSVFEVLKECVEPFLISIELRQQILEIDCSEDITFFIDKNWTKEAIGNIVKNCMEHTPEQGILSIQVVENPLYISMEIKDNGKGICKEDLPHIFERFYRGKNAGKDSVGIGLALSNVVLHHQNAQLEVESEEGKGTCFILRFYKS